MTMVEMQGGERPYDYRNEINKALSQANRPKSNLSRFMEDQFMGFMPNMMSGLMNAQNLGNSVIGNAFSPAQFSMNPMGASAAQWYNQNPIQFGGFGGGAGGMGGLPPGTGQPQPQGQVSYPLQGIVNNPIHQQQNLTNPVNGNSFTDQYGVQYNNVNGSWQIGSFPNNVDIHNDPYFQNVLSQLQGGSGNVTEPNRNYIDPATLAILRAGQNNGVVNLPAGMTPGSPEAMAWTQDQVPNPPSANPTYLWDNMFWNGQGQPLGAGPNSVTNPNGQLGVWQSPFLQNGTGGFGSGSSGGMSGVSPLQQAFANLNLSDIHGAINPQDSQFYQDTEAALNRRSARDVAEMRARYGAGGAGSRGTPAMQAEAMLRAEQAPQLGQALGAIRQGEFANELGRRNMIQEGRLGQFNTQADLSKFNAGQRNAFNQWMMGANQSAIENQINRQFQGMRDIWQVMSQFGLSGIPGGSANVSLSPQQQLNNGSGMGQFMQGAGSLLQALALL